MRVTEELPKEFEKERAGGVEREVERERYRITELGLFTFRSLL